MAGEEVSQLVILGNGFDLHFNQKTKSEDYIDSLFKLTTNQELNSKIKKIAALFSQSLDETIKLPFNNELDDFVNKKICDDKGKILLFYIFKAYQQIKNMIPHTKPIIGAKSPSIKVIEDNAEETKRQKIIMRELKKCIGKVNESGKFNFWKAYFLYLKDNASTSFVDKNWSDIEGKILDFYNLKINANYKYLREIIDGINEDNFLNHADAFVKIVKRESKLDVALENDTDEYLYRELVEFSKSFSNYLKNNLIKMQWMKKGIVYLSLLMKRLLMVRNMNF